MLNEKYFQTKIKPAACSQQPEAKSRQPAARSRKPTIILIININLDG